MHIYDGCTITCSREDADFYEAFGFEFPLDGAKVKKNGKVIDISVPEWDEASGQWRKWRRVDRLFDAADFEYVGNTVVAKGRSELASDQVRLDGADATVSFTFTFTSAQTPAGAEEAHA